LKEDTFKKKEKELIEIKGIQLINTLVIRPGTVLLTNFEIRFFDDIVF
jgi:hypothetical protein